MAKHNFARVRETLASRSRPIRRRYGLIPVPHDRYLLEQIIFPELCRLGRLKAIVFVGCDNYTEHYERFFPGRTFITIDRDPGKARYGAQRHLVDSVTNLNAHFEPGSIDAVICNGVIGWGLDDPRDIARAARAMFNCLREGGTLILGWDDVRERRLPALDELFEACGFEPLTLPPFPCPVYETLTELRHVYGFYAKPRRDGHAVSSG